MSAPPAEDVAFLERVVARRGMPSRSAAIHQAVELLRAQELGPAYADAWDDWAAEEGGAWETTVADGLARR